MEFGDCATLAEAFAVVEQCNCALCQQDTIDSVSSLVDSSKPRKAQIGRHDWRRRGQTTLTIVGLLGKETTLKKIVLRNNGKSKL